MVFLACGLNHKTAPIELREQFATSGDDNHRQMLQDLVGQTAINEAVLLSTCNRTEIYCETANTDKSDIIGWLENQQAGHHIPLEKTLYLYESHTAIKHAMRVACGLDSMMLGEPQILGQMKKAFSLAEHSGTVGQNLRPIFHHVFSASKRIRSNTALGVNPISVAFASVNLIKRVFKELSHLKVLLIGSGETSQLVAKYLQKDGIKDFFIANRTLDNALQFAKDIDGTCLSISDIPSYLQRADIIISATACPLPFITKSLVKNALDERGDAPQFYLDLSVPRDIESNVHELKNAFLYNIDDMQGLITEGMNERQDAATHAEEIIEYELDDYIRWHRSLRAKDILCEYRNQMNLLSEKELHRILNLHANGQLDATEALHELKRRLVNKLTHKPTVGLKKAASDEREDILDITTYLFKD